VTEKNKDQPPHPPAHACKSDNTIHRCPPSAGRDEAGDNVIYTPPSLGACLYSREYTIINSRTRTCGAGWMTLAATTFRAYYSANAFHYVQSFRRSTSINQIKTRHRLICRKWIIRACTTTGRRPTGLRYAVRMH